MDLDLVLTELWSFELINVRHFCIARCGFCIGVGRGGGPGGGGGGGGGAGPPK